jgi:hypothetical protein
LRGALRGVGVEQAGWRLREGRHNIWEITVHAAYWKYVVRRRLLGEKRGSFGLPGSNWFPRPGEAGSASWDEDLRLLAQTHESLRRAIVAIPCSELEAPATGGKLSKAFLIRGIAFHDIYHAGQIQFLKRLYRQVEGTE